MEVQTIYDPNSTYIPPYQQQVVHAQVHHHHDDDYELLRHEEGREVEPNFAQRWWNPKPYGRENADGEWVRIGHILFVGLASLNTVAKAFFTLVSFIPGSSSKLLRKNIVNIDKRANEGFEKRLRAREILPALFTALAVTVNPYAEMRQKVSKTNCFAEKVFDAAVAYAHTGFVFNRFRGEDEASQYSNDSGVKEFFQRNVVSRLLFLTSTVMYVAEKITHLAIGVILTACAAVTLFRDEELNTLARKYLGALDVVDHVCVGLRATLYPWQNLPADNLSHYRDPLPSRANQYRNEKTL